MDISSIQTQVQMSLQKKTMDLEMQSMQNLLSGLPQQTPVLSEPGKGQSIDLRV